MTTHDPRAAPTNEELWCEFRAHLAATRNVPREPVPPKLAPVVRPPPSAPPCGLCHWNRAGDWLARDGKTRICGACACQQGNHEQPDTR